jgi:glycosyltransferase involved in cell wall biosynthesis
MVSAEALGRVGNLAMRLLVLPRAQLVIANSEATLRSALPYINERSLTHVIPSPLGVVERPDYRDPAPEVAAIGMVARLTPWKGQDVLLRAFAEAFPNSTVRLKLAGGTWFGEEEYEQELRSLAANLGVSDRVDFLGHVTGVSALIDELDICVQASTRSEPLGQNVLQYLAAGKPTVAVNAGGPAEWVTHGQNGLLFEMGNEKDLAETLAKLAGSQQLRTDLARGARDTKGLLTDAQTAQRHWDVFRSSLTGALTRTAITEFREVVQ